VNRRLGLLAAGGLAAVLVAGAGTALAASMGPVSSAGVITGCYTTGAVNGTHALFMQDAGTNCPKGTSAVSWNEQGPAGPPGTGATVSPITASPGNVNCPDGGASITDGNGNTGYACTGATGPAGATGPQGLQGLTGPSTAGTAGLDVTVVQANGNTSESQSVTAQCPADHPYILGGGGFGFDPATGGGDVAALYSAPNFGGNGSEGTDEGFFVSSGEVGGWTIEAPVGSTPAAYAICAK
jgi:hypothetical protein